MLLAMVFAGALVGGGLLLILHGTVFAAPPPLSSLVDDLHRPRLLVRARRSRIDALAERLAGSATRRRQTDLAVCERSTAQFVQDRLTWSMLGAAPGMAFLALSATGALTIFPPVWCLVATVAGVVSGWFYALVNLRSDAAKKRREFRHALSAYLELVTILMSGGAGVEGALFDAAEIGRGSAFRQLQAALSAAQARREAPWTSLGVLGRRLGVIELLELEASMTLAGEGSRVRETLLAKAESMRVRDLAQQEAKAESRSETMVLPVAMMFAGFLLLIGYPALAGLSTP